MDLCRSEAESRSVSRKFCRVWLVTEVAVISRSQWFRRSWCGSLPTSQGPFLNPTGLVPDQIHLTVLLLASFPRLRGGQRLALLNRNDPRNFHDSMTNPPCPVPALSRFCTPHFTPVWIYISRTHPHQNSSQSGTSDTDTGIHGNPPPPIHRCLSVREPSRFMFPGRGMR